jgi:hypothetical protein
VYLIKGFLNIYKKCHPAKGFTIMTAKSTLLRDFYSTDYNGKKVIVEYAA